MPLAVVLAAMAGHILSPTGACRVGNESLEICAAINAGSPLAAVGVHDMLSPALCDQAIADAEASAAGGMGWRPILRFETREVPLDKVPTLYTWFSQGGREALFDILRTNHLPPACHPATLCLQESNVIKYTAQEDGAAGVEAHVDGNDVLTFNVLLADNGVKAETATCDSPAEGVGTFFPHLLMNQTLQVARGTAVTYFGGAVHSSGALLAAGTRYIWQGFVSVHAHVPEGMEETCQAGTSAGTLTAADAAQAFFAECERLEPVLLRAGLLAFPEDHTLLANLCAALGERDVPSAEEACVRSLDIKPRASAHNNLGLIQARRGDLVAAEKSFQAGIALAGKPTTSDGDLAELHTNLCSVLAHRSSRRDQLRAVAACAEAVRLEPRSPTYRTNLGVAQLSVDPESARRTLLGAAEASNDDTRALYHLGQLYLEEGDDDLAEKALSRVVERDPLDVAARRALARALYELGKAPEAMAQLSRASADEAEQRHIGASWPVK